VREEDIIPDGDEELYLEVHYSDEYNEIVIIANDRTLQYLQNVLQVLIESHVSGKHFHFDKSSNQIEGNVDYLVLQKK
jgi:hypothetical protein